jgi:hypothetical protein
MTELKNIKDLHLLRKTHKVDINGFMALKQRLLSNIKYGMKLYYESGYFISLRVYEPFNNPERPRQHAN